MRFSPGKILFTAVFCGAFFVQPILADELSESVEKDYVHLSVSAYNICGLIRYKPKPDNHIGRAWPIVAEE